MNTEDDPAYYNSTALYPNGTALCENLKTVDTCRAAGMTLDPIKSQCKWEDTCLPRDVVWGCDCEEFVPSGALECKANPDGDPQLGNAMIYCVLLLWSFMGVGIIADVFMEAIAVITSSSPTKRLARFAAAPLWLYSEQNPRPTRTAVGSRGC